MYVLHLIMQTLEEKNNEQVSLFRRLGAIIYDFFLLITVLFIASFLVVIPTNITPEHPYFFLFQVYIILVAFLFFTWFWRRDGQTLGMRTWKIKLVTNGGSKLTWGNAFIRYAVAIISWLAFGLGFLWSLWDTQKRTWHDIASNTKLIRIQ